MKQYLNHVIQNTASTKRTKIVAGKVPPKDCNGCCKIVKTNVWAEPKSVIANPILKILNNKIIKKAGITAAKAPDTF